MLSNQQAGVQNGPTAGEPGEPEVDRPFLYAESCSLVLGILSLLLVISGIGFWTTKPPGEADLCRVDTLGLQNATKHDQDLQLGACHGLYTLVFDSLHVISLPFILSGICAGISCSTVLMGIAAKSEDLTPRWFRYAAMSDLVGGALNLVPSIYFPGLAAAVAAGLAPIHAYYFTILLGHAVLQVANTTESSGGDNPNDHTDDVVRNAAYLENVLYKGYCAASQVELCLTVGSTCMTCLSITYMGDILRNVAAMVCHKPQYEKISGSQLGILCRKGYKRCQAHRQQYEQLSPS